jgi:hypothetical protein
VTTSFGVGHTTDPPLRPLDAASQPLRALQVPAELIPVELGEAAAMYRSALAGQRALVVLDDAATAEQVRPLLPGTPGSAVLITSRNRLTELVTTNGIRRLPLGVLTAAESQRLIELMLALQGEALNHRRLRRLSAGRGERCGKGAAMIASGVGQEGERKRTADDVS